MKVTQHGDYCYQLTRCTMVNCYLIREQDGFTLIDTGMNGSADGILKAAADLGQPIRRILLTHAHADHIGSLDALHERLPDIPVMIGARESRLMAGDLSLMPNEPQSKLKGSFPKVATRPTQLLKPDEQIGMLRVISAPGHTPGQVAYYDERDGTLIAGDAFVTKFGTVVVGKMNWLFPLPTMATWDKPTALETARTLTALNPSRLGVGHGNMLAQPAPAMRHAVQAFAASLA